MKHQNDFLSIIEIGNSGSYYLELKDNNEKAPIIQI